MNQPGLIPDPRTPEEKAKDFTHEELALSVPLKWNRGLENAPVYSQRDQDGSGSCVAQSTAKAEEVLKKYVASAHPIYARRMNAPAAGMWLQDAGEILRKKGTTSEVLDPSQKMTEEQMNVPVTVETPNKEPFYITISNFKDMDAIATAVELYGHCVIAVGCDSAEWTEKPVFNGSTNLNFFHSNCITYYFTDTNGKKCFRTDESWGINNPGHRILTEDFWKVRGTGAIYFIPDDGKPHFKFNSVLAYGMINDNDVKWLQEVLKYEGLFPKSVLSTGNYLQITAKAVLAFQQKYHVAPDSELLPLAGKRVGSKTLSKLNELYN